MTINLISLQHCAHLYIVRDRLYVCLYCVLCRLVIRALVTQSGLFEGSADKKYLSYNVDMLTDGKYRFARRLVALSFKYDGPGPQCFHTAIYKAITEQNISGDSFRVEDLPDGKMKTLVNQVSRQIVCSLVSMMGLSFARFRWSYAGDKITTAVNMSQKLTFCQGPQWV